MKTKELIALNGNAFLTIILEYSSNNFCLISLPYLFLNMEYLRDKGVWDDSS